MSVVVGVDPGLYGAMARYDDSTGILDVTDMPIWYMTVGKKQRPRVDAVELAEYFDMQKMLGAELVLIEQVGGRPKQSASAAYVFGYTVGLIYMACIAARLPIETVPPQVWKKVLNVPGKRDGRKGADKPVYATEQEAKTAKREFKKQVDGALIGRADEIFPNYRDVWRGPKGGFSLDRAEAALLAFYAGRYQVGKTKAVSIRDPEWKMVYHNADTGG